MNESGIAEMTLDRNGKFAYLRCMLERVLRICVTFSVFIPFAICIKYLIGIVLFACRKLAHPYHVSYAPVSAQDSELQSLSSDALTDDTLSCTDNSL